MSLLLLNQQFAMQVLTATIVVQIIMVPLAGLASKVKCQNVVFRLRRFCRDYS